ncbi:MAG: polymerase sigma factor SigE [Planctomycetota bacterium]|jgi:RNA polymerase sigma-70 factor (ECF subfamily)
MSLDSNPTLVFPGVSVNGATPERDPVLSDAASRRPLRTADETLMIQEPRMTEITLPRLVRDDDSIESAAEPRPLPRPATFEAARSRPQFGAARARVVRALFDEHHGRVVAFLRRLTDGERAEDLAQEVFFRLFSVKNLESREITVSYLFRIGENLVRKAYHREVRHRRAGEDLRNRSDAGVDHGSDPADRGSTEMGFVSSATLQQALASLTDNEQAAIRLIVCRGLSYEQAAQSLGVNISTINNWKHRGVRKLKQIIGDARPARVSASASSSPADPRRVAGRVSGREVQDPSPDRRGRLATGRTIEIQIEPRRVGVRRVG